MATITAPVYIWDTTDYWLTTAAAVRSGPYEQDAVDLQRVVSAGQIKLWDTADCWITTSLALRRSPGDAGYAGIGTLSIFGSGLIAPVGRHRE